MRERRIERVGEIGDWKLAAQVAQVARVARVALVALVPRVVRVALVAATVFVALGPGVLAETLVVANKAEATVSLVDLATGTVRATLPTGVGPHEVAISPDGRTALVTNYGQRGEGGSTLSLIDVPGAKSIRTIELAPYRRPHGAVFLPDGRRALVTAEANQALLIVDLEQGVVERALVTGAEVSHMVDLSPDGARAYVTNIGSGSLTVFDLEQGERVAEIQTGKGAEGLAVRPGSGEIWVTNRADDTVSVIDPASLRPVATLSAPKFPIRAKPTPDGRAVLVSCAESGDLAWFDAEARTLARRVPLPTGEATSEGKLFGDQFGKSSIPIGIVVAPDGKRAWVAHAGSDAISVIDLGTGAKSGELRAGREPDGMGYSPVPVGAP